MRAGLIAGLAASGAFGLLILAAVANPLVFAGPRASGIASTSGSPQTWTESASSWSNSTNREFSATGGSSSFFVASLTVIATNTSSTTVALETISTASSATSLWACAPTCASPAYTMAMNESTASTHVLFENLTSSASVDRNGTSTGALGVSNAAEVLSSEAAVSLDEHGPGGNVTSGSTSMTTEDTGAIVFAQPLGLLPWSLPAGVPSSAWNDTQAYSANVTVSVTGTSTGNGSLFSGLSGGYPMGGIGGSGTSNGSGAPPVPLPYLLPTFGGFEPSIACLVPEVYFLPPPWHNGSSPPFPTNNSTSWVPSYGTNCSYDGSGNETAFGSALLLSALATNGSFGPGSGPLLGPSPPQAKGVALALALSGDYQPGPAVTSVLPGSAFFGGGMRNWTVFSGYGLGIGVPLPLGYPGGSNPGGFPSPGPGGTPLGSMPGGFPTPSGYSRGSSDPAAPASPDRALEIASAIALCAGILLVAGVWSLRRPPPPGGRA